MKNTVFLLALAIGMAMGVGFLYTKLPKLAYIEPTQLYQDYAGKEHYDSLYKEQVTKYQDTLDIISAQVQSVYDAVTKSDTASIARFQRAQQYFYEQTERFQELETQIREYYVAEIWKELNAYIKVYGAENGYDFVYGADGTGNIMYAGDAHNITLDVIRYVNDNYKRDSTTAIKK